MTPLSVIASSPHLAMPALPVPLGVSLGPDDAAAELARHPELTAGYTGDIFVSLERRDGSGQTVRDADALAKCRDVRAACPKARLWAGIVPFHSWAVTERPPSAAALSLVRSAGQSSDQTTYNLCAGTGGGVSPECYVGNYTPDPTAMEFYAARIAGWTVGMCGVPVRPYLCWRRLHPMYERPGAPFTADEWAAQVRGAERAGASGVIVWDYLTTQADIDACAAWFLGVAP